ncbi:MAG: DHA2 family efflux MFS transporter permease subunit [Polyangiaceae bacterium]
MSTVAPGAPPVAPLAAAARSEKSRRWLIAVSVALGALLEIVDSSIVNVAIPQMQASLGATLSEVGWVVTSYAIANVIILPLSAWLGDRFGKTRFFVFSLVAFVASSVLCGLSTSLSMLVFARVLQGLFGGGLLAKAQSILFETFPKEEQAQAQALFGIVAIAGPAIGPTLGGYIVTNLDWRWIFYINVPIGIVAILMAGTFLPKDGPPKSTSGVDWFSILLLASGLGAMQTLLEEGASHDWFASWMIRGCGAITLVALVWFVLRQLGTDNPVVDLRVLRHRSLWIGCLVSAVIGMGLYGALFAVPIFAQTSLHFTSQQTGMLLLPGALTSAFTMPIAAKLLGKFDPRALIIAGASIVVGAMLWLASLNPTMGADDLFWPLILRGGGTVFMFLPMSMAALGSVPVHEISKATGLYNLTRQIGGGVGIAILTTLLSSRQSFHRAVLVEKLSATDPAVLRRLDTMTGGFVARGFDPVEAKRKALLLLDGGASAQAAVMSFADTFWMVAVVFIASAPLVLLLGKSNRRATIGGGH